MQIASSLTLELAEQPFLLERRIELLRAIAVTGSIRKAAQSIAMSYKSAWEALDTMNHLSHTPILTKAAGGVGGGGSRLTPYGQNLLKMYDLLKEEQQCFLKRLEARADIDTATLKTIGRFAMQISARNQIQGTIECIDTGVLNSKIHVKLRSGNRVASVITNHSVKALALQCHDRVSVLFKSNRVHLHTVIEAERENYFVGTLKHFKRSAHRVEAVIDIGDEEHMVSLLSIEAAEALHVSIGSDVTVSVDASDIMIGR